MASIAAVALPNGSLQVWMSHDSGELVTRWKTGTDVNSDWTDWHGFPAPPGGVAQIAAATLPDGRPQLFAITPDGHGYTCWKRSSDPGSDWTAWSAF